MEGHLKSHEWFVGARYSVANIALFAYTNVASEGGFDLSGYPAIRAWLDRVIPLQASFFWQLTTPLGVRGSKREKSWAFSVTDLKGRMISVRQCPY